MVRKIRLPVNSRVTTCQTRCRMAMLPEMIRHPGKDSTKRMTAIMDLHASRDSTKGMPRTLKLLDEFYQSVEEPGML